MKRLLGSKMALCALASALVAAPAAMAGDGPSTGGSQAPPPPQTEGVISAQGPQVAVSTRAGAMLRRFARFRGTGPAGSEVAIERFDEATQAWTAVAATTVAADGTYRARWRTTAAGAYRIRAVLHPASAASAASTSPELAITVHRPAIATWYGPGFYGRRTACGVRMSRTLLGVAHKTLPCGTQVAVLYKGRRITVPVVDRGPFRRGTKYDLTAATAQALGFEHTDRLGAIRLSTAE